jgi:hypothetical protein
MFSLDEAPPAAGGGSAEYRSLGSTSVYGGWTITGDSSAPPEFTSTEYSVASNSTGDFVDDFLAYGTIGAYTGSTFDDDYILQAVTYADQHASDDWSNLTVNYQPTATQPDPSYYTIETAADSIGMTYSHQLNVDTGEYDQPASYNLAFIRENDTSGEQFVQMVNDDIQNPRIVSDGDPVNMVTGEFYADEQPDLRFGGGTLPLAVARNYRSQSTLDGPFGHGWSWNYGDTLAVLGRDRLLHTTADQRTHHIKLSGPDGLGGEDWMPPVGSDYIVKRSAADDDVNADQFTFHYRDLTTRVFNADGYLAGITHANGETITLRHQDAGHRKLPWKLEDSAGRTIIFKHDGSQRDRIGSIADSSGRTCKYEYGDGTNGGDTGDLVAVTDPLGNTTRYDYYQDQPNPFNDHNIACITLPEGDFLEVFYYHNDRVAFHRNSAGDVFNFQYSPYNGFAETWNESGYYRKVFWNEKHDVTRVLAKDQSIVRRSFDSNHSLIAETDANGNVTLNMWDDRRNLLSSQRFPCKATCFPAPGEDAIWATFDHDTLTLTIHEDGQPDQHYAYADDDAGTTDYTTDLNSAQRRALGGTAV